MSKHIKDIEKAYEYLKKWVSISKSLNGDSVVDLKEMERLQLKTSRLIDDDFSNEN